MPARFRCSLILALAAGFGRAATVQLLTPDVGWALVENRLLRTETGGRDWVDVTPALQRIHAAFFRDVNRGWTLLAGDPLQLATTADGGRTWSLRPFAELDIDDLSSYAGAASIHFVDDDHGWVMLRLTSSSNFSRGSLFTTTDGGASWMKLPAPPIGDPVRFFSAIDGWLAGGPGGDQLYVTRDGGWTWIRRLVEPPSDAPGASQPVYDLPKFENLSDGTLAVTFRGPEAALVAVYQTHDGGQTWSFADSYTPPDGNRIDFVTPPDGWLVAGSGHCEGPKTQCRQETRLYRTHDGGKTMIDITPAGRFGTIAQGLVPPVAPPGPGGILISTATGFDKCTADTLANMRTWWSSSPYNDVNIYIGGASRACSQANLTSTWVTEVYSMGWHLIPTWVGPQSPCGTLSRVISSDPSTAGGQGGSEADAASDAAAALRLSGTVIYYDMEYFNPNNAACNAAVRAFVDGWVLRMHARGNLAGFYGSPYNITDWVMVANPPDAVWVAKWDSRDTVWGLSPLSDSYWTNHQRLHQYAGGHDETWGGVTFNIDSDVEDGPLARTPLGPAHGSQGRGRGDFTRTPR